MDARSLSRLSSEELQAQLQERGLPTNGKRFTLAERLSAALQGQGPGPESKARVEGVQAGGAKSAGRVRSETSRSRSRSRNMVTLKKTKAQGLRFLAEDICAVGLQASLASLDAAVAAGSVPSKLLNELESKLSTCISMVEMAQPKPPS